MSSSSSPTIRLESFELHFFADPSQTIGLQLRVEVDSQGQDIVSIGYRLSLEEMGLVSSFISEEMLEAISAQLDLKVDQELWDASSLPSLSLAKRLQILLLGEMKEVVKKAASLYPLLFPSSEISPLPQQTQAAQVFLAQAAIYLVWIDLSYTDGLWSVLPVRLPTPFDENGGRDPRMLTGEAMRCVRYGLKLVEVSGHALLSQLGWHLENFFNLWADLYRPGNGEIGDRQTGQVLLEVSSYVLELGVGRLQEIHQLRASVVELQERLSQLEKLVIGGSRARLGVPEGMEDRIIPL